MKETCQIEGCNADLHYYHESAEQSLRLCKHHYEKRLDQLGITEQDLTETRWPESPWDFQSGYVA